VGFSDAMSLVKTELETSVEQAHKFPRSIAKFRTNAMTLATLNEEVAESCFYVLPRGGKTIEGAGIRLAEIVGSSWGNLRYGARVVSVSEDFVTAQGVAHDLENNVSMTIEISRRIKDKYGKRYNDDMIVMTGNAACAIALRNAIFKVVPKAFVDEILAQAKKVAVGNATTLQSRRDKALGYFAKMGVQKERVFGLLGKQGENEIDLADLEKLLGVHTAIKEGSTTIDEVFGLTAEDLKPKKKNGVTHEVKKEESKTESKETKKDEKKPVPVAEIKEIKIDDTAPISEELNSKIIAISIEKKIPKTKLDEIIKEKFGAESRSKLMNMEASELVEILQKM
jgi:hypothetical protein